MYHLSGVPVKQDNRLPLSKVEAICLPKDDGVKREFWIDKSNMVWGYFNKNGFEHSIYLCEVAFDKLKNSKLTEQINATE